MAYLTGQRISDLLTLEWGQITTGGILFKPSKTKGSTGVSVLIGWSPRLEHLIGRLKALRRTRKIPSLFVFTTQTGQPYRYSGAHSAWARACERAGIEDCHFHDLRARALTDDEEVNGMQSARRKAGHSTEQQTAGYIKNKQPQKGKATR
jgi:integrase